MADAQPFKCPICKKSVTLPAEGEKSLFPFCSERCKLIDLARWLDGAYQIPVRNPSPEDDETSDPQIGDLTDRDPAS